jgi:protein subunit release factor B
MAVNPAKQQELNERLQALGIRREDVIEQFIRVSGPGGQKVNKTSSAVYLKHLPSGIEVKAQKDRSQAINRFLAWRLLADRLEALRSGEDRPMPAWSGWRNCSNAIIFLPLMPTSTCTGNMAGTL